MGLHLEMGILPGKSPVMSADTFELGLFGACQGPVRVMLLLTLQAPWFFLHPIALTSSRGIRYLMPHQRSIARHPTPTKAP